MESQHFISVVLFYKVYGYWPVQCRPTLQKDCYIVDMARNPVKKVYFGDIFTFQLLSTDLCNKQVSGLIHASTD